MPLRYADAPYAGSAYAAGQRAASRIRFSAVLSSPGWLVTEPQRPSAIGPAVNQPGVMFGGPSVYSVRAYAGGAYGGAQRMAGGTAWSLVLDAPGWSANLL